MGICWSKKDRTELVLGELEAEFAKQKANEISQEKMKEMKRSLKVSMTEIG